MYHPNSLSAPTGSAAAALAAEALRHTLTVYAGAGVSAAAPASLPGASDMAELLVDALSTVVSLDGVSKRDLVAVADTVVAEPQGELLLKRTISQVANLTGARPTYAHAVLALMLCEGAATVLETNYDDCIERAGHPERLPVVITDADRIDVDMAALLKAHGCATRPATMLVTSQELANPPLFASTDLAARLSVGSVAFVGIGSPADYVKSSLDALVSKVGSSRLTVIGPQTGSWLGSGWQAVLPALPPQQRVAETADSFCDALLRAYLGHLLTTVSSRVSSMGAAHGQRLGVEALCGTLAARDGVWVLRWLRACGWLYKVGEAMATSDTAVQGLLALGALGGGRPTMVHPGGWSHVNVNSSTVPADVPVLLIMSRFAPLGTEAAVEAANRVVDARTNDRVPPGADVVVVCCGQVGPLGAESVAVRPGDRLADVLAAWNADTALDTLPENIVDEGDPSHLLDSATTGRILLIDGHDLIEAA